MTHRVQAIQSQHDLSPVLRANSTAPLDSIFRVLRDGKMVVGVETS